MFIPDPDLDFLLIPDPGVKKAPDSGYKTLARDPEVSVGQINKTTTCTMRNANKV
jgi:hypothetical protein